MVRNAVSLFRRVNRFVPTVHTNPRENRLTEAFAAVLDRVDGLAHDLAMVWLDPHAPRDPRERPAEPPATVLARLSRHSHNRVEVATQVPVGDGFVDLELRFIEHEQLSGDDVRLWVEVKHGTPPERDQLRTYSSGVGSGGVAGAVILLAPGALLPDVDQAQVPGDVPQRAWEQVGRVCSSSRPTDSAQRWLLDEFVTFLREEGLMAPDSIGPEHLTALTYHRQAERALDVVCRQARSYVESHWAGRREHDEKPHHGLSYGVRYGWPPADSAPPGPPHAWLEWGVNHAGTVHPLPADGAVFLMAGLGVDKPRGFATTEGEIAWSNALKRGTDVDGRRVEFHHWSGTHERLHRVAYPYQVLCGSSLAEQGAALGRWIVETFDVLCDPPVPYPPVPDD